MDLKCKTDDQEVNAVDAQLRLWQVMRNRQLDGFRFVRQVLVEPFIVDFACVELKLIVELDDAPNTEQQYYDLRRTEYLRDKGFIVMRFWRNEILTNMANVVSTLRSGLAQRAEH
jgi:very-short-patch-repair endonuclease